MLLKQYKNHYVRTIIPIAPYDRLIGTAMGEQIPQYHFDPDPLYRATVFSQGWDPEKDISPSNKEYARLQKRSKEWLKSQKKR